MPTLEQVCKRLFSTPSWFLKCVIGGLLLAIPFAHFVAFGYLYELLGRARRGDSLDFPEWDDWRRMFVNGIPAFVIFLVLGVLPIGAGWALTFPLRFLNYGVFVYLPLVLPVVLSVPLTAAGIYQYQKREEYRDAFRIWLLLLMLRSSKGRFLIPVFATAGFIITLYPLMTFSLFAGMACSWAFYGAFFRSVEEARKAEKGCS